MQSKKSVVRLRAFSGITHMAYENVLKNPDDFNFEIEQLGEASHSNPCSQEIFVEDSEKIIFSSQIKNLSHQLQACKQLPAFEKAGARKKIFHNPATTRAAIITCGGLCPGLNNVIKGFVNVLEQDYGVKEIVGIRYGYKGLTETSNHEPIQLNSSVVEQIHKQGGTILGSSRGNQDPEIMVDELQLRKINLLFCIGGDGTLKGAQAIAEAANKRQANISVVGVPKTIDNDLDKTFTTFGFDTAVSFATECIDRLHSTAASHRRIMVVEVMGRYAGWIALHSGIAANAHGILIPEIPYDIDQLAAHLLAREAAGQHYAIVIAAEGANPVGGNATLQEQAGTGYVERLGGIGEKLAHELQQKTGKETRAVVLGHLLRGGSPSAFDRVSAMRFGAAAVRALDEGHSGIMVALAFPDVNYVALEEVAGRMKNVPLNSDCLQTARDLHICLGD